MSDPARDVEPLTAEEEAEVRRMAPLLATQFPWYAVQEEMPRASLLVPALLATLDVANTENRPAPRDGVQPGVTPAAVSPLTVERHLLDPDGGEHP